MTDIKNEKEKGLNEEEKKLADSVMKLYMEGGYGIRVTSRIAPLLLQGNLEEILISIHPIIGATISHMIWKGKLQLVKEDKADAKG